MRIKPEHSEKRCPTVSYECNIFPSASRTYTETDDGLQRSEVTIRLYLKHQEGKKTTIEMSVDEAKELIEQITRYIKLA